MRPMHCLLMLHPRRNHITSTHSTVLHPRPCERMRAVRPRAQVSSVAVGPMVRTRDAVHRPLRPHVVVGWPMSIPAIVVLTRWWRKMCWKGWRCT